MRISDWSSDVCSSDLPVAVDGVLYTATGYSVVRAFDAATGRRLWAYDPGAREAAGRKLRQGWGSRRIGWWDGKVYTGPRDGRLTQHHPTRSADKRAGREGVSRGRKRGGQTRRKK